MKNLYVQLRQQILEEKHRLAAQEAKYSVASRYRDLRKADPRKSSGKLKRLQEALARLRAAQR